MEKVNFNEHFMHANAREYQEHQININHIYVLREELNSIIPLHTHKQGHVSIVLDGVATIHTERNSHYIPNGYFCWVPPEIPHQVSFEVERIRTLNIYFPAKDVPNEFYSRVAVYPILPIISKTVELIKNQNAEYAPEDWQYKLLSTLKEIFPNIIQNIDFKLILPISDNPVVNNIIKVIARQYHQNLALESVGDQIGMSERSISRYMRKELKVSFYQYLRMYRILEAIKLMTRKDESLTEIAFKVGYDSLSAFSSAFYAVTGLRPSQFGADNFYSFK